MYIIYDAKIDSRSNNWYGTIVISNMRFGDGHPVTLKSYLSIDFSSPAVVSPMGISPAFAQSVVGDITTANKATGDGTYDVNAIVPVNWPYTLQTSDEIRLGFYGNLTGNARRWVEFIILGADVSPFSAIDLPAPQRQRERVKERVQGGECLANDSPFQWHRNGDEE
jgi:hypothetical protein